MFRIFLMFCCLYSVHQYEPVLSCTESYKLSLQDFKSKPNLSEIVEAIIASGISFGFSIRQTDDKQVVSYSSNEDLLFYPEQSQCKFNQADNHILNHEQLHFDITELFARNLDNVLVC